MTDTGSVLCRTVFLFVLFFAVAGGPPAVGQPTISADRPGFGDDATPIAPGLFQVELGAAVGNNDFGPNGEVGQVLLRVGVTDRLELRGGIGSLALDAPDAEYTGTSVGGKLRLIRSPTSTFSLVSTWALPTGSGLFATDRVAQTATLAFEGTLGEGLGISVNVGTTVPYAPDPSPTYQFIPTLSVSLTEGVGGYVGYAGFYPEGTNMNFVEAGLTLLATDDMQLDVNTGLQVDPGRTAFFLGVGLGVRV